MSGEAVLTYILSNNAGVLAQVVTANIIAGTLPTKTQLPGIGVQEVDSLPHNMINVNEKPRLHTDRVQVTALARSRGAVRVLLRAVLAALPDQRGSVGGVNLSAIVSDMAVMHPYDELDDIHSGSRDFLVSWVET